MAPRGKAAPIEEDLSDLKDLVVAGKSHEDELRAKVAGQNSYIGIVPDMKSKILKPGAQEYIEGAVYGGFYIGNKGLALGTELEVTVLGVFKFYEESEVLSPGAKAIPKIYGYWIEEDAVQVPLEGQFDRPFVAKNGESHVLRVVHWMPVVIKGHEEITDALFSFRSKGNQISTDVAKILKKHSEIAPQLRFKVTVQEIAHESFNNSSFYPKFDLIGENFNVDAEGNITLVPKNGMKPAQIRAVVEKYNALQTEYAEHKMVSRKSNIAGLIGAPAGGSPKQMTGPAGGKGYTKPAPAAESPNF